MYPSRLGPVFPLRERDKLPAFKGSFHDATINRVVITRLRAPGSRHLIARLRFNHAVQSLWHDTIPKALAISFPGVEVKQDKAAWFMELPNGSQLWLGGLDDKERTDKILGNEFATVMLNECSQLGLQART